MKTSKKCPKCQSSDIIRIPGLAERGGNIIPFGWTIFTAVKERKHRLPSDTLVRAEAPYPDLPIRSNPKGGN